jgi:hypothetical protein
LFDIFSFKCDQYFLLITAVSDYLFLHLTDQDNFFLENLATEIKTNVSTPLQ